MEIDISSLTVRLKKSLVQTGLTFSSERKTFRGEKSSDFPKTREISAFTSSENKVDISSLDNNKIDYQVNLETKEIVIRFLDRESGKVVRQIPGEEFLKLTSRIADFNQKIIDASA